MHDSSHLKRIRVAVVAIALTFAAVTVGASPAHADSPTTMQFVGETSVTSPFGAEWSLVVQLVGDEVSGEEGSSRAGVLGPNDGTVSVTVSSIGGTFSEGIPIQADGTAYISQPIDKPLLPAGEYTVSAIFWPASGTNWTTSQTAAAANLTITPLTLDVSARVNSDPTISSRPFVEAELSGEYVDTYGSPAGVWSFVLKDHALEVFSTKVAQEEGRPGPVRVDISTELPSGRTLILQSTFSPIEQLAGGVQLSDANDAKFVTASTSPLSLLTTRVPFPTWATLTLSALIVLLVAGVVVFGIRLSRRGGQNPPTSGPTMVDTQPDDFSWDDELVPTAPDDVSEVSSSDDDSDDVPTTPKEAAPKSKRRSRSKSPAATDAS